MPNLRQSGDEAIEFFHFRYRHVVIPGFSNYPHIQTSPEKGTEAAAAAVVVLCAVES